MNDPNPALSGAAASPLVRTESLSKTFGRGPAAVRAVAEVSLEILRGELVLIMGASGSGKTTLLSMIGGLLRPSSGRIFIEDTEMTALRERELPPLRARKFGFIFQAFNLLDALTVEENILLPSTLVAATRDAARARARTLMDRLGLLPRRRALPGTLSGGEKQRAAIARALINDPPLILADEPTGSLDSRRGMEVVRLLHALAREEGRAVIMVTHDIRVEAVADRLLRLEDGRLRDQAPAGQARRSGIGGPG